ncbi:hypothetical protein C7M84_014277 [Penaeus vannamei]|uniref:Uncharacterized protein n=1 Tax=Penaeus vannamei TaxID=6689 RepID=A0A3R7NV75_PENVA|nr:hypothetical protein C7M84_014277 [Penaeus vannamei]
MGHLLAVGALVGLGASTSRKNERGKTPQDLLGDRLGKSPAERVFSLAKECAADEKERMRNMQEEHEKQENDLREMKKKVDSKEAEAANLRKENGKLKQELHEMKEKCDSKEAEAANLRKENGKLKQELHEMKEKCDSKEAEAANLRKENGKLKQDLQENKNEIKLIKDKLKKQEKDLQEMKRKCDLKERRQSTCGRKTETSKRK